MDNLRFIRETMERAGSFTAVPGWGGFAMGVSALAAAWIAARESSLDAWLVTWLVEGFLAISLGALAMKRKADSAEVPMLSAPARRFVLEFLAAAAGGRAADRSVSIAPGFPPRFLERGCCCTAPAW